MSDTGHLLLAYFLIEIIACLTPGPAVAAVTGIALTGSLRSMIGAVIGINTSSAIWYVMAGIGLSALVKSAPLAFAILGWAGIGYLIWMGIETWRAHAHLAAKKERTQISMWKGFSTAVAVQLSNPKALVFFTVFLPPFVNVNQPVAPQLLILAIIGIATEVMVLTSYGLLAYRLGGLSLSPRAEKRMGHIQGALLIAIGLSMAMLRLGYV
ncbi:MAG: LysE family transporter [Sphingomonadaceae bacterium]